MTQLNPVLDDSAAAAEGTGPMLSLQAVYLKDASFESPQGPREGWPKMPEPKTYIHRPTDGGSH
mgnify:CR=1 FL=1